MSVYSFGEESPLKFNISDKLAQHYNEAAEQFFKAQTRFNQKFGRQWDPVNDPIKIKWNRNQKKAWADFSKVFDKTIAEQGPFHVNDIMEDFLVKNVGSAVADAALKWRRLLGVAVASGALYGYYKGR